MVFNTLTTAGGSGGAPIEDIRNDRRQSEGMVDFKKNSMDQLGMLAMHTIL